jgi:hypothetical protein
VTAAGWRAGAGAAAAVAAADPGSWALGLLGFLVRGGALLVMLPILSVPSPVLLSMLFRGEVGMIGRGELRVIAIGVGVVLAIVAILGVIASAYADLALAERFVRDSESEGLRQGRRAVPLSRASRRSLLWWVASVQAVALLPVIGVVSLLVASIVRATTDELLSPTTTELPLVGRVLPAIGPQLLIAGVVLVLVEMLSSLATRRLMANAWGLLPAGPDDGSETRVALRGAGRLVRRPARVIATALTGWLVIGTIGGFVLSVTLLAWGTARDVLVAGGATGDPVGWLAGAALIALFAGVWIGGLGLIGFATALRSGLWTADAVR